VLKGVLVSRYAWVIDDDDLVKIASSIFEKYILPYFERKREDLLDEISSGEFLSRDIEITIKNILVQKFRTEFFSKYVRCDEVEYVLLVFRGKPYMLLNINSPALSDMFEELGIVREYANEIWSILRRKQRS
jgi:hypothetical protein